ncbi:glycoside hydrolase family 172 protein [Mycobacterium intracellulare]|uniref:glycoside hydrolase family 172 protein n=1 Tax=Mycobacterium intracellulare TaxID=1767 RepID=UPI001EEF4EE7|nr:glycoside hydrolase family 172 protein [Mycobacterium intracellulare]MEE3752202.1 glycoside hydrolase family 172 protein [Mycobacterium intracellulare]
MLWATAGVLAPAAASAEPAADGFGERLVGWDTYRRLDRLPYLDAGSQTLQVSSFDRSGGDFDISTGNRNGTGGCLAPGGAGCVIAEDHGAGEIDSIWLTRDGGNVRAIGHIRIELDGQTVVDTPLQSLVDGEVGAPFAWPLVANAAQSPGGVYVKVPMPYRRSMRVSVTSHLEYYHVDYRRFPNADGISTFSPADPAGDVLDTLRAAGTADPKPTTGTAKHDNRVVDIPAGSGQSITETSGPGSISALRLQLPAPADQLLAGLRLQIEFDGRTMVDAPLGEFFGAGLGANPVRSLLFAASPQPDGSLILWGWWPMPFADSARVTLVNTTVSEVSGIGSDVTTTSDAQWAAALASGRAGYFTARAHAGPTVQGQDWVFADEQGHGKFVGVSQTIRGQRTKTAFSDGAPYFLEGAERVYTDGAASPQWYGTGTEDLYEGGWYFKDGTHFSDPLNGQPDQRTAAGGCADYCVAVYRIMLADAIGYRSALRFGIEHGKRNMVEPDYSSTAFLYTQPATVLTGSDDVRPADPVDRVLHGYTDTDATDQLLVSEYEGTEDTLPVVGSVRGTQGAIAFHVQVDPDNRGVLLRRTSDQATGFQSADVAVDGMPVGTWLQPRSNTFHRWLDDTYLVPQSATAGKAQLTITLTPTPDAPPWTASRYHVDALTGPSG